MEEIKKYLQQNNAAIVEFDKSKVTHDGIFMTIKPIDESESIVLSGIIEVMATNFERKEIKIYFRADELKKLTIDLNNRNRLNAPAK